MLYCLGRAEFTTDVQTSANFVKQKERSRLNRLRQSKDQAEHLTVGPNIWCTNFPCLLWYWYWYKYLPKWVFFHVCSGAASALLPAAPCQGSPTLTRCWPMGAICTETTPPSPTYNQQSTTSTPGGPAWHNLWDFWESQQLLQLPPRLSDTRRGTF